MEAKGRVAEDKGQPRVAFYGLSTCGWCKKTRALLEELGVPFEYAYVDLLTGAELDRAMAEVRRHSRGEGYPTLVIDGSQCIVGFKPDEIKRALGK